MGVPGPARLSRAPVLNAGTLDTAEGWLLVAINTVWHGMALLRTVRNRLSLDLSRSVAPIISQTYRKYKYR